MTAPPARSEAPNVLVIVLDCVRADDFPGAGPSGSPGPFFDRLRSESVVYRRATSVAPWTVPAHATLFTGLYPWEHRAHAKGTLPLDPSLPRLPTLLHDAGYATVSLSANPLLNPQFGLVDGFDAAAWSEWWEPYLRNSPGARRPKPLGPARAAGPAAPSRLQKLHDSPLVGLLHRSANLVYRYPFLVSAANHWMQRVTNPGARDHALVAQWIDPTFAGWLRSVPAERPIFAFVNLLEAHEPYFADPAVVRTLADYWRYARTWQDRPSVLSGRWAPTPPEVELLRALYRSTFRLLEERVRRLVEALEAAGRWENTLLLLTSDHGQAFLENGTLFHMHRPDEGLLRVPLWVRHPHGRGGGRVSDAWASLVDVAPTVLDAAGVAVPPALPGVPLGTIERASRIGPVLSMADGLALAQERRQIGQDRMAWIDRAWVAVYDDDRKVTLDLADGRVRAYHLADDPNETSDLWPTRSLEFEPLATRARAVGAELTGGPAEISAEVEDRLRSWGYV